ncbi:MAG: O-antigen ligase family protein, partial [Planctomycetota bacterium]|nr:O-antigen ligase family protein [Planctomycetota bacterium]
FTLAASVGAWLIHHGVTTVLSGSAQIRMAIPGGQMSDRNDFMVAGTACIPMLVYIGWSYQGAYAKWLRPALKFGTVFAVGALFYSLSRGAFLGFTALLVWYGILTGRFFQRLPLVLLLGLVIAVTLPDVVIERMTTLKLGERQTESSAINRLEHMHTAVEVTLDFPLTGVGPAVFPHASRRYSAFTAEPHSLWLKCSAELGLPMLIFFLMLVARLLWRLNKVAGAARLRGDKDTEHFSTALSCALVGFLATGTFTSQFMSEYMWAIIALIGAFLATPIEQATGSEMVDGEEDAAAAQPALTAGSA